ncbi:preprotein translocase subunit SecG [Rhizomicrobium electricum]|jgi:preprotein translocase subunit SecG|uniref:Protein-export membrane protein SecG n=1 Tax=Rhizomicrobium electricum TaxID=480070 RepID=A0ABP3PNK5_9PROT|nr:preprotein translocase subunit SecG [Rhizomicrobium electricum]NIJ48856.1 preprotein translocase subunit SecG [Rhizomicrobium electricum]
MQTLLLVIELVVAVLLIVFILLQRSEGGALGIGGGGGGGGGFGGLFSPRGAADTLTRTTSWLAVMFFVVCLALNLLVARAHKQQSAFDSRPVPTQPAQKPVQQAPAPQGPSVPTPH